jgi:hypothetical protein
MARHTLCANVDDTDFDQALELVHHFNTSRSDMIRTLINRAHRELLAGPRLEREAQARAAGGEIAAKATRLAIALERKAAYARPREATFQERADMRRAKRAGA